MAVIIDARARTAIARRRAGGHDAAVVLHLELLRARPHVPVLAIDWACRFRPPNPLVLQSVDNVAVYMEYPVALYTQGHDVRISAWRLGPFALLWVVADLLVAHEMVAWQRNHLIETCTTIGMDAPNHYPIIGSCEESSSERMSAVWDKRDVVKLKKDRPALGLTTDTRGIISMVYAATPTVYEVKFVEDDGQTIITRLTVEEHDLEWVREGARQR